MRHLGLCLLLTIGFAFRAEAAAPPLPEQWIIVVAANHEKAIAPLVKHRKQQGLRVVVVRVRDHLSFKDLLTGNATALRDHVRRLCRRHPGRSSVLLVGTSSGTSWATVPALRGSAGRMRGQPSDCGYGCLDDSRLPTVAVGRLPARGSDEAAAMVDKTIALERNHKPGAWRRRLTVLAGIPAYNPLVDRLIEGIALARFDRMNPIWTGQAVYTASSSRFCLPPAQLRPRSKKLLAGGQAFILYLGHSSAEGLYAGPFAAFLDRDDWARLSIDQGSSVFVTFGCNGCQAAGRNGEGYGLAAVRNPRGPAAVIGSQGICYASMVQLACDGLFQKAFQGTLPARLGDCWLAALQGVARGRINYLSYRMLDAVDGDPNISQADQRQEHLEMFTLLGDPALRLPQVAEDLTLQPCKAAKPGQTLLVRGRLPVRLRGGKVGVSLLRSPASLPLGLTEVPGRAGPRRDLVLTANFRLANTFELAQAGTTATGLNFEVTLKLPEKLPGGRLHVRAVASSGDDEAIGVQLVEVSRPEK